MSKDYCASPALRVLGPYAFYTGPSDSLQSQNTYEVPDGAIAVVTQGHEVFQFDRDSTATAVAGAVIVPAAGPGRWIYLAGAFSSAQGAAVDLFTPLTPFAVTTGTWANITGATFESMFSTPYWTLTTGSGLLTYNGPSGKAFEVAIDASIGNGESGALIQVGLAVSKNGDVSGSAAFAFGYEQQCVTNATINTPTMLRAVRHVSLAHGDTIQPAVRNVTAGDLDLNIQKMVMTVRVSP